MTRYIAHVRRPGWTRRADWSEGPGTVHRDVVYGQAITGRPFAEARLEEAPLTPWDEDWIRDTLATFIAPGGKIVEAYARQPLRGPHPGMPPAIPLIPAYTVQVAAVREYSDIPGGQGWAKVSIRAELLEYLTIHHGPTIAEQTVDRTKWQFRHPRWPGDTTQLTGTAELATYTASQQA